MLLDGLAQGTSPLAMYDADVFQMCHTHLGKVGQVGIVQVLIQYGNGLVHGHADQVHLRGNGEGLGHPELAGICFGHRRCGNCRFLDADKVFYVRGGAHDAALHEEVALCIRQAADRTLEPHGNNAHGIAFFELFGL